MFRGEETLVTAELVYVFADPHLHRSKPIPESLKLALAAFEAGEPMVTVADVAWSEAHSGIVALRKQVFVDEMKGPPAWVSEPADTSASHLALVNRLGGEREKGVVGFRLEGTEVQRGLGCRTGCEEDEFRIPAGRRRLEGSSNRIVTKGAGLPLEFLPRTASGFDR